jgi:hypothetical protein
VEYEHVGGATDQGLTEGLLMGDPITLMPRYVSLDEEVYLGNNLSMFDTLAHRPLPEKIPRKASRRF